MTTLTTSSILTQAAAGSPAGIQAWTGELMGALIACGLTQTNDSGQLTLTGSGGTATSNATQPVATGPQSLYALFTFNDSLAGGNLSTTALLSGGSGYTGGPYTGLTATGATSGATATVSVSQAGGVCGNLSSIVMVSGKFIVGEKITVAGIAGGSGANWTATALSTGAPVIFRLDFGGNSVVTNPSLWITVGQGTNGSGTISGSAGTTRMTQVSAGAGAAPLSIVTAYTSYYCYNPTTATCLVAMKFGGEVANAFAMGFYIHRSNNSSGVPTGASVSLYANSNTTTPEATSYYSGIQQTLAYATSTVYPSVGTTAGVAWPAIPSSPLQVGFMGITSTLENSTIFLFNGFYFNPGWNYSAFIAVGILADVALGTTVATTLVGTEAVTLISLPGWFGVANCPYGVTPAPTMLGVFS